MRAGGSPRRPHLAGALAEEAAAALLERADTLHATLLVQVPAERVLVEVAEAELVRALRNLISNALNHALGQQREVIISVDSTPDTVTFAVADSGPGLTLEQLAALSQPLVRGANCRAPGSGLGLAIVTEILTGHGSTMHTGHDPHGRAQLSFTLPRLP